MKNNLRAPIRRVYQLYTQNATKIDKIIVSCLGVLVSAAAVFVVAFVGYVQGYDRGQSDAVYVFSHDPSDDNDTTRPLPGAPSSLDCESQASTKPSTAIPEPTATVSPTEADDPNAPTEHCAAALKESAVTATGVR